jgi:hypothetical protein
VVIQLRSNCISPSIFYLFSSRNVFCDFLPHLKFHFSFNYSTVLKSCAFRHHPIVIKWHLSFNYLALLKSRHFCDYSILLSSYPPFNHLIILEMYFSTDDLTLFELHFVSYHLAPLKWLSFFEHLIVFKLYHYRNYMTLLKMHIFSNHLALLRMPLFNKLAPGISEKVKINFV